MRVILLSTSLIFAGLYLLWMTKVLQGWYRYAAAVSVEDQPMQSISIIIPFKDEAASLPLLLDSLDALDYDLMKFELVLVNDSSTDQSAQLVAEWIKQSPISARLLCSEIPGKKAAQNLGVRNAQYNLIACTDADCIVPSKWLHRINASFQNVNTSLAFGPVKLSGSGSQFQKLEFNALIASTMGMLSLGWPIMGNGANMAFRKESYLEVVDEVARMNTPSGDDVFLLHQLAKKGKSISIIVGADAMVSTRPQPSLNALLDQRIRWASKAKYYTNRATILIGALVFFTNVFLLVLLFSCFFLPVSLLAFILVFVVKLAADFILLRSHASYFKVPFKPGYVIIQEFLNMIYIPAVAVLSQVKGYTWKGRRY